MIKIFMGKNEGLFPLCQIDSWEDLYTAIAGQWGAKLSDMIALNTTWLEMLLMKLCPADYPELKMF